MFVCEQEVISEQEQAMQRLHENITCKDEESRKHQRLLEDKMRELEEIRNRKSKYKMCVIAVRQSSRRSATARVSTGLCVIAVYRAQSRTHMFL